MKKITLSLILAFNLFANDIILVGNKNCKINNLTNIELKNLYLGLSKISNDEKVTVFDRNNKTLHEEFIKDILKKSVVSIETYWVKMLFSGRAKPPVQISSEDLSNLNNFKECTITYISQNEYKNTLKRISIVE